MNNADKQYFELCRHILGNGAVKTDRTGTGTLSTFGWQMRFDLSEGFPLLTTKKLHWPSIAHELIWFLSGDTNVEYLRKNNVRIWDAWANKDGDLGPVYGQQWRNWGGDDYGGEFAVDQIAEVIEKIRKNPDSRRLIVNAWNVGELPYMALPPCHFAFQFYVANGKLSCQLYQRSADVFLGLPFNIASYSLITHMIAHVTGLDVGEFVHTIGDAHIYANHTEQVRQQLTREPRKLPTLGLSPLIDNIDDFTFDDIGISGYDPHPHIAGRVAI